MALPADVLSRIEQARTTGSSAALQLGRNWIQAPATESADVLPLGLGELDRVLPDHGVVLGTVTELAVHGVASLATTLALAVCRAAQHRALLRGGDAVWCAFVDPSATLYAPGVAASGVVLDKLLVARPPLEALSRVALRIAESRAFAVVVIDTAGVPGRSLDVALGGWPRVVRRLAMAVEQSESCVLLLTNTAARRPLPLPVSTRLELRRPAADKLALRVAKDRYGRVSPERSVRWPAHPWHAAPAAANAPVPLHREPRSAGNAA
jgi:recombination protein RecA